MTDGGATASTPPKLSLSSFPNKVKYSETPPGMVTPPLRTSAISIPFEWEEAPGKPRGSGNGGGGAVRCLELPPRLLSEGNNVISSSPTTVLDGPYLGRSVSLRKGGSFRGLEGNKESVYFGSSRWGGHVAPDGGIEFSSSDVIDDCGGTQVKITKMRRKGSFLKAAHAGSHVWGTIYASLKQVVPWRRGREKSRSKTY